MSQFIDYCIYQRKFLFNQKSRVFVDAELSTWIRVMRLFKKCDIDVEISQIGRRNDAWNNYYKVGKNPLPMLCHVFDLKVLYIATGCDIYLSCNPDEWKITIKEDLSLPKAYIYERFTTTSIDPLYIANRIISSVNFGLYKLRGCWEVPTSSLWPEQLEKDIARESDPKPETYHSSPAMKEMEDLFIASKIDQIKQDDTVKQLASLLPVSEPPPTLTVYMFERSKLEDLFTAQRDYDTLYKEYKNIVEDEKRWTFLDENIVIPWFTSEAWLRKDKSWVLTLLQKAGTEAIKQLIGRTNRNLLCFLQLVLESKLTEVLSNVTIATKNLKKGNVSLRGRRCSL